MKATAAAAGVGAVAWNIERCATYIPKPLSSIIGFYVFLMYTTYAHFKLLYAIQAHTDDNDDDEPHAHIHTNTYTRRDRDVEKERERACSEEIIIGQILGT